jgi:hypothetical protein
VESISFGHPVMDCAARRSNPSNYLVTSSRYIRIFSQVLIGAVYPAELPAKTISVTVNFVVPEG